MSKISVTLQNPQVAYGPFLWQRHKHKIGLAVSLFILKFLSDYSKSNTQNALIPHECTEDTFDRWRRNYCLNGKWSFIKPIQLSYPECTDEGSYDDWGCVECYQGQEIPLCCTPNFERYAALIENCENGNIEDGCFNKSYYRERSMECLLHPTWSLCDGKYNYAAWVSKVKGIARMFREGRATENLNSTEVSL